MLSLLFNRFPKRRVIGLLALGEWGPPSGAITGSISTEQPGQEDVLNGSVTESLVLVGGWRLIRHEERPGDLQEVVASVRTKQARQQSTLQAELEFVGDAVSAQSVQDGELFAGVEIVGSAATAQPAQSIEAGGGIEFIGSLRSVEAPQEINAIGVAIPSVSGIGSSEQSIQRSELLAHLHFAGSAVTAQAIQSDVVSGDMIDVELEMITAILIQAA